MKLDPGVTFRGDNEETKAVRGYSAPILGLVGAGTWMLSLSVNYTGVALLCGTKRFGMDFISDHKLNKP